MVFFNCNFFSMKRRTISFLQRAVNLFTALCLLVWSFLPFGAAILPAYGAVSGTQVFPLVSGADTMSPGAMRPLIGLNAAVSAGEALAAVSVTVRGDGGFQISDLATMTDGATTDGGFNILKDNKATGQVGMPDPGDARVTLSAAPTAPNARFSKITPSGSQLANGVSALTAGDILFSNNQGVNPPGYNWHLVTTGGANPGDAALRVDGNTVTFATGSRISKLTPAGTALGNGGTAGGTLAVIKGDLVFARRATENSYTWHIATGAGTTLSDDATENDASLDDQPNDPAVTATTQLSKIAPSGTATDNGATPGDGNQLAVAVGDLAFVNITGSGYGWHAVTTAGNLSSQAGEQAGVRLDGGNAPQIVANSQMSKISTGGGTFQIITDDIAVATPTAVVAGDVAFSLVGSFPFTPQLNYQWFVATTGCDVACGGVAGSAMRLNDEPQRPGWAWKVLLPILNPPTDGVFPTTDNPFGEPDYFITAKASATATNGVGFGLSIPNATDIVLTGGAFTASLPFGPLIHIDSTPFSVQANVSFPPNGAPNIPPDMRPHVTFNKDPNPNTISSTTVLLKKNNTGDNLCANFQPVPGGVDCLPSTPLEFGVSYTLTVTTGVTDMSGTALATNFTSTFTTGSGSGGTAIVQSPLVLASQTQPPQSATYPSNAPMLIPFSQDMAVTGDGSVLSSSNIFLKDSAGNGYTGTLTYTQANKTVKFAPTAPLAVGNSYVLTITNKVKGTAGKRLGEDPNGVPAPDYNLRFTTVQMQVGNLTVGIITPANNDTQVAPNKSLTVSFSSQLDSSTVNSSTVQVKKTTHSSATAASNGDILSGTLALNLGDIVFRKPASGGYGWALVTTANGVGTNPGLNGAAVAGGGASSVLSKITPTATGTLTGSNPAVSSIALNEGDVVFYGADGSGTNYRWGLITTSSGAAAAYTVNGAQVDASGMGGNLSRVSKVVPQDFGAVTDGAKMVGPGELIFTSTTQNPNGSGYDWHVVTSTAPVAINNANLRLDGSSSAPTFASGAKFAKFAPAFQSLTTSQKHTLVSGDLVFGYTTASPASTGYGWHAVTTAGDKPGADALRFDGMGTKPTYSLNTLLANFTSTTGSALAEGNTIRFTPQFPFTLNTQHTLTVQGGAQGVKDLIGNPLATSSSSSFTTAAVFTVIAPFIMGVRANTTSITVEFSDQMKKDSSTNGAENSGNYTLESPIGTPVSLTGKTVTFDSNRREATLTGLNLIQGNTFKIIVSANAQSAFSNSGIDTTNETQVGRPRFGQPRNEFPGKVESATTLLQPGMGMPQGGLQPMEMMQAKLSQTTVFPKSPTAGAVTTYEVEFGTTQAIPANGVIQLQLPTGTSITAAAQVTEAGDGSKINNDINGSATGTVVLSTAAETSGGANNDGVTIDTTNPDKPTINIKLGAVATQVGDRLKFQIKGIGNPTQSANANTSTGNTVTIKTYDTTGAPLDILTSNPIFVSPCGPRKISGRVLRADASGLNGVRVGAFQYMGGQMVTTANNAAGGGQDGEYQVLCLPAIDRIDVNVDPSSLAVAEQPPAIQPVSLVSGDVVKNIQLTSAPRAITVNITGGPASKQVDVGGQGIDGTQGFVLKTVTLDPAGAGTATLNVNNNTTWDIRVMPFIPKDPGLASAPPTFEFDQQSTPRVVVGASNPAAVTIALASLTRTITGKIINEAGTGIQDVFVKARKTGQAFGADLPGTTKPDGTFSIPVSDGTYIVEAVVRGFQRLAPIAVSVSATGQIPVATQVVFKVAQGANTLTISGKVVDSNGQPINEASVLVDQIISETDETPIGGNSHPPILTDESGNYDLFVSAGTWRVEVSAPSPFGYLGRKIKTVTTDNVTLDNFTPASLGATISGRVTIANTNISGAFLWARSVTGPETYNTTTTTAADPNTNYTINVPSGTYEIGGFIPRTATGGGPLPTATVSINGNTTQNFNFAAGNEITVQVTTGAAQITDAFVTAFDSQNNPVDSTNTKTNDATGINGIYKLKPPAGIYTVRVGSTSRGPIGEQANVNTTGGVQTITITDTAKQSIAGTIRSAGAPLEGANVTLSGTTGSGNDIRFDTVTATDGTYTLFAPAGKYRLLASKATYIDSANATSIEVVAAGFTTQDRTLNLTTTTGKTVSGTVSRSDSKKSDGGFVGARSTTTGASTFGSVKSDGTYSMPLDPGTWQIKAVLDGFETLDTTVTVAGSDITQNFTASPKSGYTKKAAKAGNFKRDTGGVHTDKNVGDKFEVRLPPNMGGSSSDTNISLSTKITSAAPTTATAQPMGGSAITVSAESGSGVITSLSSSIDMTIPYDPTKLPAGKTEGDLFPGYLDATKGEWIKETQCTQDQTNNLFACKVNHLSDFAVLIASSSIPTPTGLTATATSATTISLGWTAVSGATSYNIYRSTSEAGTFSRLGSEPTVSSGSTVTYSDTGLSASTQYFYKMSAKDASGESASSSSFYATTQSVVSSSSPSSSSGGSSGGAALALPAAITTPTTTTTTPSSTTTSAPKSGDSSAPTQGAASKTSDTSSPSTQGATSKNETTTPVKAVESVHTQVTMITSKDEIKSTLTEIKNEALNLKYADKAAEAVGREMDTNLEKETLAGLKKAGLLAGKVSLMQKVLTKNFVTYGTPLTSEFTSEERQKAVKIYRENSGKLPNSEAQLAQAASILKGVVPEKLENKALQKRVDANVKTVCGKNKTSDECKQFEAITKGAFVKVDEELLGEAKASFKGFFKMNPNPKDFFHQRLLTAFAATGIKKITPPPAPKKETKTTAVKKKAIKVKK